MLSLIQQIDRTRDASSRQPGRIGGAPPIPLPQHRAAAPIDRSVALAYAQEAVMQSAAAARGGAPQWLRRLLSEEFFDACPAHPGERKNDKNHLCVDCAAALCRHCLPHEPAHDVLQIWKYASCFVVRVDDLRLFDCTGIQSHTVSDHEVVFLNERTARKRSASPENPCAACARPLLSGHDYCSLFCKVKHIGESEHGLRRALRVIRQDEAATPEPQSGKRRPSSSSDAGLSCGGSFRKRSRKQPEPAQAPFR